MQLKVDPRSYTLPAPGSYDPLANIQATYAPRTEPPDAVPGIQRRRLGASELLVSECTLGGMTWGEQNSDAEASEQLSLAFDFGVNFIDTAEACARPRPACLLRCIICTRRTHSTRPSIHVAQIRCPSKRSRPAQPTVQSPRGWH